MGVHGRRIHDLGAERVDMDGEPERSVRRTATPADSVTSRERETAMTRTTQVLALGVVLYVCALIPAVFASGTGDASLDRDLAAVLSAAGFSGDIQHTFQTRLRANLG